MKKAPVDLSLVTQLDWARLAAYIDAEGCISIAGVRGAKSTSRRVAYVDVVVGNTDPRLPMWIQDRFGGSIMLTEQKNEKWASNYRWNVASRHAVEVLKGCLPYFVIKREQAEIAIRFQATILVKRPYGMKGRPQSIVDEQDKLRDQLRALKGTASKNVKAPLQEPPVTH